MTEHELHCIPCSLDFVQPFREGVSWWEIECPKCGSRKGVCKRKADVSTRWLVGEPITVWAGETGVTPPTTSVSARRDE